MMRQNPNNHASCRKGWIRRYTCVATKDLDSDLGWWRLTACSPDRLARVALWFCLISSASASFGVTPASAQEASAQEQVIKCENLPAEVRTSFEKAYPKATIKACAKELKNGQTAYEIMSTQGNIRRDVLFYEDGKLIVVEEAIAFGELPEPVQQAVSKRFPGGAIELAEKLMRDATVTYEIHLKHGGKCVQLEFDPSGKEVTH